MQLADITLVAVGCIPPVEPNTALEEENIAVERMAPAALARLHFPVSGMSISRTLFFIPARIPPDSLGFLFFPEEFFTGTSFWLDTGIPNYSGITGILRNSCSRQPKLP